jgi:hypothetical protein
MQPRKPTKQEEKELFEYFVMTGIEGIESIEQFYEWIDNSPLAVFDNYRTDYPEYAGKVLVMLPTYDLYPEIVDIYVWQEGKITKVTNKEEMEQSADSMEKNI